MTLNAVVIDSREPDWVKALKFDDVPVSIQALPTGDAWLATDDATIIVERKTMPDLLGSIADGRLFDQVARMVAASPWNYTIVTEFPAVRSGYVFANGRMTKWTWASVQGALATIQEIGSVVVWCNGDAQYKATLEQLANRNRDKAKLHPRRETVMQSSQEQLLCSIDGLGDILAKALIEHCGSAAWALEYLTDDGEDKVDGIGEAKRTAARFFTGLSQDLCLRVLPRGVGAVVPIEK